MRRRLRRPSRHKQRFDDAVLTGWTPVWLGREGSREHKDRYWYIGCYNRFSRMQKSTTSEPFVHLGEKGMLDRCRVPAILSEAL